MSISKTKLHPPENSSPKPEHGAPKSEKRSVPPPPPSARPIAQRPTAVIPSPLPPPTSARVPVPAPTLPRAPAFAATPIAPQIRQLEEETSSLRKRLAAQRAETRTEQRNNELLRNELALLRTQVGRNETSAVARTELQSLRDEHLTAMNELKSIHRVAQTKLQEEHGAVLRNVRKNGEKELESLQRLNTELEQKITETEHKSTALQATVDALKEELAQATAALRLSVPTVTVAASPSEQGAAPAQPATSETKQSDELTRIKGIGPAFAKALAAEGVTTFAQIAAWTEADVERLAPLLRTTATRIKKNDWPGAARKYC